MLIGCFSLQGETGMTGEGGQVGERVKALFSSRPADFCLMLAACVCACTRVSVGIPILLKQNSTEWETVKTPCFLCFRVCRPSSGLSERPASREKRSAVSARHTKVLCVHAPGGLVLKPQCCRIYDVGFQPLRFAALLFTITICNNNSKASLCEAWSCDWHSCGFIFCNHFIYQQLINVPLIVSLQGNRGETGGPGPAGETGAMVRSKSGPRLSYRAN